MSSRYERLSRRAGLEDRREIEPDPGAFTLDDRLDPIARGPQPGPPAPRHLVRRTSIPGLTTVARVETALWTIGLTALYVAIAVWLAVDHNLIFGDSLSRVASAAFAAQSRDPHLAAVGFVFPPLPTVLSIPLLPLRELYEPIADRALAAAIISAVATAFAAVEVVKLVRIHTGRVGRSRLAGIAFALNPLVVLYAANGMSEALFAYLVLRAGRGLAQWAGDDDVGALVVAGIALGAAYLVRYEAVVAAAGALAVVVVTNLARDRERAGDVKRQQLTMDATTVLLPIALTFVGWAIGSWLITGEPFQQFSSEYGNSSIIELESGGGAAPGLVSEMLQGLWWMVLLAPLLPLCLVWALRTLRRTSDLVLLAPVVPLVAVLAFSLYSTSNGSTFQFLRYFILVVPLGVLVAAVLFRRGGLLLCAAAFLVAPVTTWIAMGDRSIGVQEHYLRAALFPGTADLEEARTLRRYDTERRVADALDRLRLPDGTVLVDAIYGHPVVLASDHPKQFVVSTDRDFEQALDRPSDAGVRYLLTVPDTGRGRSDALNRRYPGIYETGAGIAQLVVQAQADGPDPPFRLYRVLRPAERVNGDRARAPSSGR